MLLAKLIVMYKQLLMLSLHTGQLFVALTKRHDTIPYSHLQEKIKRTKARTRKQGHCELPRQLKTTIYSTPWFAQFARRQFWGMLERDKNERKPNGR